MTDWTKPRNEAPVSSGADGSNRRVLLRYVPGLAAALPALFLIAASQYGGLMVPFWDHVEAIRYISAAYDHTLAPSSLWEPHNEHRPLGYRALVVVMALVTRWDMRIELVALAILFILAYGITLATLFNLTQSRTNRAIGAVVLSAIIFSPCAHNNHWWGMMLQLALANVLVLASFFCLARAPRRLPAMIVSAPLMWLAGYTFANGIIALFAALLLSAFLRCKLGVLFWLANIALFLAAYLPGLPYTSSTTPSLTSVAAFVLINLGAPIAGLIWYPYDDMFTVPRTTLWAAIVGVALCIGWTWGFVRQAARGKSPNFATCIVLLLALFAAGNAALIGFGRAAFDEVGIANANASRYITFASYLSLSATYLLLSAYTINLTSRLVRGAMAVATVMVVISYARSWHVYRGSRAFDAVLRATYTAYDEKHDPEHKIFPNPKFTRQAVAAMQKRALGAYRLRSPAQ